MACENRLAGMEKNSKKFLLVWKDSVLIQKLCLRRDAQAALGEEGRSETFPSTLSNALGCHGRAIPQHRELNVVLFPLFCVPKMQRKDPSVSSQIRVM